MKKIFTIISCFLFLSCSKNYLFKRDTVAIYNELTKINEQDQKVRKELIPIYYKYNLRTLQTVVDSIDKLGLDYFPENLNLNFENIDDQIKKLSATKQKSFQKEHDDQWKKINHTDSINFEKIYNIVKKYGFIDFDTREWKNDSLKIGIISTTTHFNYRTKKGKKLLKLIISEYKKGRVDDSGMTHFLWYVRGRGKGSPNLDGKTINEVILELKKQNAF